MMGTTGFAITKNGECVIDYWTKVPVKEISMRIIFMTLQYTWSYIIHNINFTFLLNNMFSILNAFIIALKYKFARNIQLQRINPDLLSSSPSLVPLWIEEDQV